MKNPIRRAWEWLYPPKLRNKAGGMAWIVGQSSDYGEDALNGRAVKTLCLTSSRHWLIEPPQEFIPTADFYFANGPRAWRGVRARITGMADCSLEPWKEAGDDARDESLRYLPPVPTVTAPSVIKTETEESNSVHLSVSTSGAVRGSTGRTE